MARKARDVCFVSVLAEEAVVMQHIRPPAVAGAFYPAEIGELSARVDEMLARVERPRDGARPKALIVPHAGYMYSGPVAASAYARLQPVAASIDRVVLLGPAHRVALRGVALPDAAEFATPLGAVAVEAESAAQLQGVVRSAAAHASEHALEVQLPFLIRVLDHFRIVPLLVGAAPVERVAAVMDALWNGPSTLVIVSSDLSHYLPYDVARQVDATTIRSVLELTEAPLGHEQACGATAINALLTVARKRQLRPQLLDLRNSGDTAGRRDEVVGYAAVAFYEKGNLA